MATNYIHGDAAPGTPHPRRCLLFVVESSTDVRLVEGLAERFDLHLVARRIPGGGVAISQPPAADVPLRLTSPSRFAVARAALECIWERRRDLNMVLVQNYGLPALAVNLVSRLTRTPAAMLVCSPVERYYRCRRLAKDTQKPFRRRELALLNLFAFLNAAVGQRYVVLSDHLHKVVRERSRGKPIHVVPVYGVDTQRFSPPAEEKGSIRAWLKLPTDGPLIFFSSRIAPEKDSATLLSALRVLHQRGISFWLLHRSGGYQEFLDAARRAGIDDRTLAGDAVHPVHELPRYYQAADVCVQASREEGLGFSVLEALACELPVVASRVGGLTESVLEGRTGWTYAPGDAAGLATALENALFDHDEAQRRAAVGRELVVSKYDRTLVFQRLVELVDGSQPSSRRRWRG